MKTEAERIAALEALARWGDLSGSPDLADG
jgi:hypothetical protein